MLRNRRRLRKLSAETLERRDLLAADPFGTNLLQPLDVTRDGAVTPFDALVVINALQQSSGVGNTPAEPEMGRFLDVDGDGQSNPGDVLAIINAIAQRSPILVPTLSMDSAPTSDSAFNFDLRTNDYAIELNVSVSELTHQTVHFRIGDDDASFFELTDPFVNNRLVVSQEQIDGFYGSPLPDGDHRVTIQLRDAGQVLQESEFELTVDRVIPVIESVFPNRSSLTGTRSIALSFSGDAENLLFDPESIQLVPQDGNAAALLPVESQVQADGRTVEYTFAGELLEGTYLLHIDEARLSTQAGNAVGASVRQFDFEVVSPTAVWTAPDGGRWDDPSHWQSGQVPVAGDVVSIQLNEDAVVDSLPTSLHLHHLSLTGGSLLIGSSSAISAHVIELHQATIDLAGGVLSNTSIAASDSSSRLEITSDSELSGVTLEIPATIEAGSRLTVRDGLTVNGSLSLEGANSNSAELNFAGGQSIDGSGSIIMAGTSTITQRNRIWATGGETVTLGAELSLFANFGDLNSFAESDAPIDLRSNVNAAENGSLTIGNLGSDDGTLDLNLNAPLGTVRLGSLADVIVNNSGATPLSFSDHAALTSVTLNSPAVLNGDSLLVRDRLTLNSNLTMSGIPANPASLSLFGTSTLDGNGTVVFNDGGGNTLGNRIVSLMDPSIPVAEQVVVIGDQLTIGGGSGLIGPTFSGGGGFDIRGTIASTEDGRVELTNVFSSGALTLDSESGVVELSEIRDVILNGTRGSRVVIDSPQSWSNVTLNLPALIDSGQRLELSDGLTLNSTIALSGSDLNATSIDFLNDQTVVGNGSIIFAGTAETASQNVLDASGAAVTFGSGVYVRGGNGTIVATSENPLLLEGRLWVNDGDQIELSNVVTSAGTLTIEPQVGQVVLAAVPPGTTIDGVEGSSVYSSELLLDDVTLNIDLVMSAPDRELRVENGLTLNGTIRFAMTGSGMSFVGAQSVSGTGTIEFATFDPDTTDGVSVAPHSLTINETNGEANEELTINSGITIQAGQLTMGRGSLADNGIIRILGGFVDQNAQVTYDHNIVLYT